MHHSAVCTERARGPVASEAPTRTVKPRAEGRLPVKPRGPMADRHSEATRASGHREATESYIEPVASEGPVRLGHVARGRERVLV